MFAIRHATVHSPETTYVDALVLIDDGRIAAVEQGDRTLPGDIPIHDASGLLLVPGFLELQLNGGFGLDFTADPNTIWTVAAELPRYGVTAFLPTVITSPADTVRRAQQVLADGPPAGFGGAAALGLHLEGPFLNPAKKGAHNPAYLRAPDVTAVAGWSPEAGVRLVTLAPELPGAPEVIDALVGRGVVVSAGHSLATHDQATAAFALGVRYVTHLFNAMPAIHHREPGLVAAALADPRVTVGIIPDGLHVHPALVDVVWRATGANRLNVVTDAMAALGMPPGEYVLGDYDVAVDEVSARLPDGTLAGCIMSLDDILRNLTAFTGCTLGEALATVSTTPARLLGLDDHKGRIAPGYDADLVLLTPDMRVVETFVNGQSVFRIPNRHSNDR